MNTPLPVTPRAPRLFFAILASLINVTLFLSVAIGLTGEDATALIAQIQEPAITAAAIRGA